MMNNSVLNRILVVLAAVWIQAITSTTFNYTLSDQNHCTCRDCSEKNINIECIGRLAVREVRGIIDSASYTGIEIFDFTLKLQTPSAIIPANLLGGRQASRIFLYCNSVTPTKLQIDPNAFRTSSFHTETFRIYNCDLREQTGFLFLSDFEKLHSLSIQNSLNIGSFYKLPALPSLRQVVIYNCTRVVGHGNFPSNELTAGLKEFDLALNTLGDDETASILSSLADSPSANTLKVLRLSGNRLSRMPSSTVLSPFHRLSQLFLDGNNISSLGKDSFTFSQAMPNLSLINLMDAGINYIEPGTLDNVQAKIQLDVNNLSRLRKSIFKPMLELHLKSGKGGLTITSNQLECEDCGMAWLFRDNRNLLDYVHGSCVHNSTNVLAFEELSASNFANCTMAADANNDGRSPSATWFYFIVLKMLGIN